MTIECIYCVNNKHKQCNTPDLCACAKANHKRRELLPALTSDELNKSIAEICDSGTEKAIPYIGWFWRNVDWDNRRWPFRFGIIPREAPQWSIHFDGKVTNGPPHGARYVGFMESNKWDYPYSRELTDEEFAELRALMVTAVTTKTPESIGAVRAFVRKFDQFDMATTRDSAFEATT